MQGIEGLVDNLFRREAGRVLAVLVRIVGPGNLALAEDVVQDALCRALEVWKFQGVPDNPAAWIISVAKHRAIDLIRREKTASLYSQSIEAAADTAPAEPLDVDALFQPSGIAHEQLRMMFTCCHPDLSEEAQVALVLHVLCGFSTREIAAAFLASASAAEKRLVRAKKTLSALDRLLELDAADVAARLPAVQRALYLLFNEGFHGANPQLAIRQELCREALYLTELLLEHPLARSGPSYGLAALMCLHAARLTAREDGSGDFVPLESQDRSRWDHSLILKGHDFLGKSAQGSELSEYQLEAAIASVHTCAATFEGTDWRAIVSLYSSLLQIRPTAIVQLNHAIAVGQCDGAASGLQALHKIDDSASLDGYPFYWAALGEFELQLGRPESAREHFQTAEKRARNPFEARYYARRRAAAGQG